MNVQKLDWVMLVEVEIFSPLSSIEKLSSQLYSMSYTLIVSTIYH